MRRLISFSLVALLVFAAGAKDVVFTTWNMKWFPSGRADLRASEKFENFKIRKAGGILSEAFTSVRGTEKDGSVIFLEELRDADVASNLVSSCSITNLKVVAFSHFRDRAGYPIWQQSAILSNLPVVESGMTPWQSERKVNMPRGFVWAVLETGEGLIACFCVHFKANVSYTGTERETQTNIFKREFAAAQILAKIKELRARYGERLQREVVAGDFNTNEDDETFVSEDTIRSFYGAHFRSCFRDLPKEKRITHPGNSLYPPCTFDYILYRGFGNIQMRRIGEGKPISDHNPVSVKLALSKPPKK